MTSSIRAGTPLLEILKQVLDFLAREQLVAVCLDDFGQMRRQGAVASTTV